MSRAVTVMEDVGPGVRTAQVQCPLCPFLAVGSGASGSASLCLSFHICKMGMKIPILKVVLSTGPGYPANA